MFWTILGTISLMYFVYWCMRPHLSCLRHLPEPPRWPLLQYNFDIFKATDIIDFFMQLSNRFKDGVYKINFIKLSEYRGYMIFTSRPEHLKTMFSYPKLFTKPLYFKKFFPLTGDGLLTSTGKEHAFQKKLLAKLFTAGHVTRYTPIMNHHADRLLTLWKDEIGDDRRGKNIELQHYMHNVVFDIFCETAFGFHYDSLTSNHDVVQLLKEQISTMTNFKGKFLYSVFRYFKFLPFSFYDMEQQKLDRCRNVLEEIISKKKEILALSEDQSESADFLTMMIKARDEETKTGFTDKYLRDNLFSFLLASFETTGTAIPWVLYALAMNINEQEKARKEILSVLDGQHQIEDGHLSEFSYFTACIKEALRLYTPVPFGGRVTEKETKLGTYDIPAGQMIVPNFSAIHRQEDVYENPDCFNPGRFLTGVPFPPGAFVPFGYGPYNCIGQHFAMLEIKVIVARILQTYSVVADEGYRSYNKQALITVTASPPITLRFIPLT